MTQNYNTEFFQINGPPLQGNRLVTASVEPPLIALWNQKLAGAVQYSTWSPRIVLVLYGKMGAAGLREDTGAPIWDSSRVCDWDENPRGLIIGGAAVVTVNLRGRIGSRLIGLRLANGEVIEKLKWMQGCLRGVETIVRNIKTEEIFRVRNDNPTDLELLGDLQGRFAHGGDPLWYSTKRNGDFFTGTRTITALNPKTGKTVWEAEFPYFSELKLARNWMALTKKDSVVVLNANTGRKMLQIDCPEAPNPFQMLHPDLDLILTQKYVWGSHATLVCREIRSGRIRWEVPACDLICCTGEVIWALETYHPSPRSKAAQLGSRELTVARSVLTGAELWRTERTWFVPGERCLYSWSGRTVTCWVSASDPRVAGGKRNAAQRGKKPRAVESKVPPVPDTFQESLFMATEDSKVATYTVGQILKVLRRKFAEVTLLPGHVIEIYNEHSQYLGRVSFRYGRDSYLPKGTRKVTDETDSQRLSFGGGH